MLRIAYSKAAAKQLIRLPSKTAQGLVRKIKAYAANPLGRHPWAKAFGDGILRIRQGNYRALCEIDHEADTLFVHEIGDRKEIYR